MAPAKGAAAEKLRLLDSDDDEDADHRNKSEQQLQVNKSFAKRLAHNRQREALHRLQELQKRGKIPVHDSDEDDDSDDESSEEDEENLIPRSTELQFYDALSRIKGKDPAIYKSDVRLFDEVPGESEGEEGKESAKKKKSENSSKAVYLKDVVAKQLLEDGPDLDDRDSGMKAPKTYAQEQDEYRKALIDAADAEAHDDEGFISVKKKSVEELRKEKQEELEGIAEAEQKTKDVDIEERLNQYFGKDDDIDENERFLKSYLLNKGWIDREGTSHTYEDIVGVSEDEEELEEQDRFEAEYKFRFQEGAGDQVLGHPRFLEGSIRKRTSARSLQRKKRQERLELQEFERKEELKHLKNIKKKEIFEKLQKIRAVAGVDTDNDVGIGEQDIDDDFDPDEYDRKMREAFGDEYYAAEDPDEDFHGDEDEFLEKPNFDAEDELLGHPKGWDGSNSDGFEAARKKVQECKSDLSESASSADEKEDEETANIIEKDGSDEKEDMEDEGSKTKNRKKGRISLREKLALDKQLEEYYKLDYEDVIGDIRTRFKYGQVHANSYGMKTEDILFTDDKELNQYVSLKKLAPYHAKEWKPSKKFKSFMYSQKKRKRIAMLKEDKRDHAKKRTKLVDKESDRQGGKAGKEINADEQKVGEGINATDVTKKKRRRRPKKKGPVLPASRMSAYMPEPSLKSKQKKKA